MSKRHVLAAVMTVAAVAAVGAAIYSSSASSQPQGNYLPLQGITPGVVNAAVTQANIHTTICISGYTTTIRPSVSYTNSLKLQQMPEYSATGPPSSYEEDHLIALEVGGNPTDPRNLWPEPRTGQWPASKKDHLENVLHAKVCSGTLSLADAQDALRGNWVTAYQKYVGGN